MSNPRLPNPGEDGETWGGILNEFLLVGHNPDGTNKVDSSTSVVSSVSGRSGDVTLSKSDIGLSNVDNTTDANKPVSVAAQNSLNQKANSSSLSAVATSGQYSDLLNKPILPDSTSLVYLSGAQLINGEKDFIGSLKASGSVVVTTDDTRLTNSRTPSDDSVSTTKLQDESVTEDKLVITNTPATDDFLQWDGANLVWQAQAASATVTKADVGLGNVDNTSDADKPVSTAVQTQLDLKATTNDTRFTDQRTPTDDSVSTVKVQDSSITEPKLSIANSPSNGNFLAWDGTNFTWQDQAASAVASVNGRTGAITLTKADVGLSNVDDTSDVDKPVSTATQTVLDTKAATSDARFTNQRTPSDDSVSTVKVQDSSITEPKLAISNAPASGNFIAWDGMNLKWQDQTSAPVASVSGRTGAITLTKADVGLTNVDNTNDANKPISTATQVVLDTKALTSDSRFTDERTPTDDSVSTVKVQDSSITESKLAISNTPAGGNFLAWDGTNLKWQDQAASAVTSVSGRTGAVTLVKADVGLGSVDNTTDAGKPVSTATQTALDLKAAANDARFSDMRTPTDNSVSTVKVQDSSITEPKLSIANSPSTGNFLAWDGTSFKWQDQASGAVSTVSGRTGDVSLTKSDVGLSNVDNTNDASKPISTATQTALNSKVDSVSGRTGAITLTKADVGLSNVDNTTDVNKPVSTATQTLLDAKISKSGDTMTGALTLPGNPTNPTHAATKAYVDSQAAGAQSLVIGTSAPTPATGVQVLWLDTTGGNVTLNLVTGD